MASNLTPSPYGLKQKTTNNYKYTKGFEYSLNGVNYIGEYHISRELLDDYNPLLVYVLDNQWCDKTSLKVTKELLNAGESVFIWPEALKKFKDLNELCVHTKRDEIAPDFILKHIYKGMKGIIQLSQIKHGN